MRNNEGLLDFKMFPGAGMLSKVLLENTYVFASNFYNNKTTCISKCIALSTTNNILADPKTYLSCSMAYFSISACRIWNTTWGVCRNLGL